MRLHIAVIVALALTACSTSSQFAKPGKETEAVRDFVVATELQQVKKVRIYEQMKYLYVNDDFIVLPTSRGDFLVEFRGPCTELRSRLWTADMIDIRVSARVLFSGHDTIRGCVIGKFYELPEPQLEELRVLGDAPGSNVYIPGEN